MRFSILLIVTIMLLGCEEHVAKQDVLDRFNNATNNVSSVYYESLYLHKPYSNDDTISLKASCWIELLPEDSIIGMKVKMLNESGFVRCYDGENYYTLDNIRLKATIKNPRVSNVIPFKGSVWDGLIFSELLDGMPIDMLNEFNIVYELEENTIEDSCHVLKFLLPDSGEFTGYLRMWIDKKTYLPEKMISEFYFQGNTQYLEISISKLTLDANSTTEVFLNFKIPDNYVVEYYSPPENGKLQLLSNDALAPNFSLLNLDGDKVTLQELKGKMVLIDFWYTSCYPCIKAMPYIEKLHNEYANKGLVVLGVNPIDTNDVDKLNQFLSKNEITYPILLANQNMVNSYLVHSYPSLYLIDKEGTIVFSEIGFDKSTAATLDSLIGIELNN